MDRSAVPASPLPRIVRSAARPTVFEWTLCPAPVAAAPTAAVLVHLRRDQMALQRDQGRLALRQAEIQHRRGLPGRRALASTDRVQLRCTVGPGELQHNPPPHRVPAPRPPTLDI